MTAEIFEPFFLNTLHGRVFCLYRAPKNAKDCVLFVPPFAEEMNKCRKQITAMATALVARGRATLLLDLYGTGDSAGEFSDATWQFWMDDVNAAVEWARSRNSPVQDLIAGRLGCILAADALRDSDYRVQSSIFWQPVLTGKQFMTQFLRLRVAASMMSSSGKETVSDLKLRLADNETVEIAGYELSPTLFAGVESVDLLQTVTAHLGSVQVVEIGSARDNGLSPAGQRLVAFANSRGMTASGERLEGEPFWSATEIVVNDELARVSAEHIIGRATSEE